MTTMHQLAPKIAFDSCTAMVGDAVLADAQRVTFHLNDGRFSGDILVPPGTKTPPHDQPVHLFVPGHGPAEIRVSQPKLGHVDLGKLHFEVEWMSPDLYATCGG
jgi:hypothetical protein